MLQPYRIIAVVCIGILLGGVFVFAFTVTQAIYAMAR
jgi:hypothetical protein